MKIFYFLLLVFMTSVVAQTTDPCGEFQEKFCEKGSQNEKRWKCLAENFKSLSETCKKRLHDETHQSMGPCYISALAICHSEDLKKSYICLAERLDEVPDDCKEHVRDMRKTGREYKKLIREKCAGDFKKYCPGMNEEQQVECLSKVYKDGNPSPKCDKAIDSATGAN